MQFELLIKKIKNQLTIEEEVLFKEWYYSDKRHQKYFKEVEKNYYKNFEPIRNKEAWASIAKKLNFRKSKSYRRVAIAASFIALIGIFSFYKFKNNYPKPIVESSIVTVISEEKNGNAILTLDDGTNVVLTEQGYQNSNITSNGSNLIYDLSEENSVQEEIVYNYLYVPRGGDFFIQLSDGTKVWLNAESKLKFPVTFTGASRSVELIYGEAYFEVSPCVFHQGKSFIVHSRNQIIEVLGTEFNLKAYKEESNIVTTLIEGKVALSHIDLSVTSMLSPNEQATFDPHTQKIDIRLVDIDAIVAWRKGVFSFKDKSLKDIMFTLARWYDFEVVFENEEIANEKFNGIFRKTQKIENILEAIQKTREAVFQIDDNKIVIKKP